jgi:hypothetical protein
MSAQPQRNQMNTEIERELARRIGVAQAQNKPAELEIAGNRYRLVPVEDDIQTTEDPAANYDLEKMLAAIDEGAGAFEGMDVAAFNAEILEAREQDTPTHSF